MDRGMPDNEGLVPPLPREERQKKYPPIQWRPLRVMNPWHKVALVVILLIGSPWLVRLGGLAMPASAVTMISDVLWPSAIIALARSFRGEGEPVAPPRPWWRLSARPAIGWVIGAFYVIGELLNLFFPVAVAPYPQAAVGAVFGAFLGAAFLNSSIRLTIERRRAR